MGADLAIDLTEDLAVDLAGDLAGGGGVDFRLSVSGAQASFRRAAANEGGVDSNCVLADGDTTIQALTDLIPQADKYVPETEYVVAATAPTYRPLLGPNGAIVSSGSRLFEEPSALAAQISAAGALTMYTVFRTQATGSLFFVSDGGSFSDTIGLLLNATVRRFDSRSTAGSGDVILSFSPTSLPESVPSVIALQTVAGDNIRAFVNGALSATGGVQSALPAALDTLRLFVYSGGFFGDAYEFLFCLDAHDAPTIASVSASLLSYWQGRGVSF